MPKVSVIIPVYNGEKYISQAIESVLSQSFQDFEIVITDDGSTDGTVAAIKQFEDPRIRLLHLPENRGVAVATTSCVTAAAGELIAIIDADNVFLPQKLERQIDFLSRHPEIGAVFTQARLIDDEGELVEGDDHPYSNLFDEPNRSRHEWLRHFFFKGNCLCHPSAVIRKECYERVGYYDPRLSQLLDLDLWIRLCLNYEIHILSEPLLKFRIRGDDSNLSGQSEEAVARHDWQASRILDRYLGIPNTRELMSIFPEAVRFGSELDDELIPYYLAMLAFDGRYAPAKVWALDTLHDLLGTSMREKLKTVAGFAEIDFIRLTTDPDVFGLGRRIRRQEQQIHRLECLNHELSETVHRQWLQLSNIESSLSWKITQPLRSLWMRPGISGLIKRAKQLVSASRRSGFRLECDRLSFSAESLDLSGWAISDRAIEKIEVYVGGQLIGHASYGLSREDVQRAHPELEQSGQSGFHFQAELKGQPVPNGGKVEITLRAIDQAGRIREISLPALQDDVSYSR